MTVHVDKAADARGVRRLVTAGVLTVLLSVTLSPATADARSRQDHASVDRSHGANVWTPRPPLTHGRVALSVVRVGGQILAIGGSEQFPGGPPMGREVTTVEARPVAGRGIWRDLAPMPTARANLATAVLNGRVYAIGGFGGSGEVGQQNVVETFDPRTGRWEQSRPLPQPRGGPAAATLGGLLYVVGGEIPLPHGRFKIVNSMVVYNPRNNTWRNAAPMPTARENFTTVTSGGFLYAIGGLDSALKSVATVERYDPRTNHWRTMSRMVESRAFPCAVETTVNNRRVIAAVGGSEFSADMDLVQIRRTTEVFDISSGRWTLLNTLLPTSRGSLGCARDEDGAILAIGGGTLIGTQLVFLRNVDALHLPLRP